MSDTPRTNARCQEVAKSGVDWHHSGQLLANFARQLELELNEALKWKNEDPRMLREQCRVSDAAYSQIKMELEKEKAMAQEVHEYLVAINPDNQHLSVLEACIAQRGIENTIRQERAAWKAVATTPKA